MPKEVNDESHDNPIDILLVNQQIVNKDNIQWELAKQYAKEHSATQPNDNVFKISKKQNNLNNSFIYIEGKLYCVKDCQVFDKGNFSKVKMLVDESGNCLVEKIVSAKPGTQVDSEVEIEIAIGKKLNQHIVDFERNKGQKKYIVQPYLGRSIQSILNDYKNKGEEPPLEVRQQLAELAIKAVVAIHKENVLHRDLHAGNILIQKENGEYKGNAVDLGLARQREAVYVDDTDAGTQFNSKFLPPEYMKENEDYFVYSENSRYDKKSDIFQLGMMLKHQLGLDAQIIEQMIDIEPGNRPSLEEAIADIANMNIGRNTTPLFSEVQLNESIPNQGNNNGYGSGSGYGSGYGLSLNLAQTFVQKPNAKIVLTPLLLSLKDTKSFSEFLDSDSSISVNYESEYDKTLHHLFGLPPDFEANRITALSALMARGIQDNEELILKIISRPEINVNIPDNSPLFYALKSVNVKIIKALHEKGATLSNKDLPELINQNTDPDLYTRIADVIQYLSDERKKPITEFISAIQNGSLDAEGLQKSFTDNVPFELISICMIDNTTKIFDNEALVKKYIELGAKDLPHSFIKKILVSKNVELLKCLITNKVDMATPFKKDSYSKIDEYNDITPALLLSMSNIYDNQMFETLIKSELDININYSGRFDFTYRTLLEVSGNRHDCINLLLERDDIQIPPSSSYYLNIPLRMYLKGELSQKAEANLLRMVTIKDHHIYYDLLDSVSPITTEILKKCLALGFDFKDEKLLAKILSSKNNNELDMVNFLIANGASQKRLFSAGEIFTLGSMLTNFDPYKEMSDLSNKEIDSLILRSASYFDSYKLSDNAQEKIFNTLPETIISLLYKAALDSPYLYVEIVSGLIKSNRLNLEEQNKLEILHLLTTKKTIMSNDEIEKQLNLNMNFQHFMEASLQYKATEVLQHFIDNPNLWQNTGITRDLILDYIIKIFACEPFKILLESNIDCKSPLEGTSKSVFDLILEKSSTINEMMLLYIRKFKEPKIFSSLSHVSNTATVSFIDEFYKADIKISADCANFILKRSLGFRAEINNKEHILKAISLVDDGANIDSETINKILSNIDNIDIAQAVISKNAKLTDDQKARIIEMGLEKNNIEIIQLAFGLKGHALAQALIENSKKTNIGSNELVTYLNGFKEDLVKNKNKQIAAFKAGVQRLPPKVVELLYFLCKKNSGAFASEAVNIIEISVPYTQELKDKYTIIQAIENKNVNDEYIQKQIDIKTLFPFLIDTSLAKDEPAVLSFIIKNNMDMPPPYDMGTLISTIIENKRTNCLKELVQLNVDPSFITELILKLPLNKESVAFQLLHFKLSKDDSIFQSAAFVDYLLRNNGIDDLVDAIKNGAKTPSSLLRPHILNAIQNGDDALIGKLQLSSAKDDSLFADPLQFMKAAKYVHRHLLSTAFTNGNNIDRWSRMRSLALFDNGQIIDVPPQFIYGAEEAISLCTEEKAPTLEEISLKANLPKEMIGKINIDKLKSTYPNVVKIVHRQNHGLPHSVRAAGYIPVLHEMYAANNKTGLHVQLNDKEIESLQLMMLFSVAGREDETGFHDKRRNDAFLYQSYRSVDAIEFIRYVNDNWHNHYCHIYNSKEEAYQAAYVVELMGYHEIPDPNRIIPPPIFSILAKGFSPENFNALKEHIKAYPCNRLNEYTDEELKSFFPDKPIALTSERSSCYLNYMNGAHGIDLMRCYKMGNALTTLEDNSGTMFTMLFSSYAHVFNAINYRGQFGRESIGGKVIDLFLMSRSMLNTFGEPTTTYTEKDTIKLQELRGNADALEIFLTTHLGKSYSDFKDSDKMTFKIDGQDVEQTFQEWLNSMNFARSILDNLGFPGGKVELDHVAQFVPRYISMNLLKQGNFKYSAGKFDFCQYHEYADLRDEFRDTDKEVEYTMLGVDNSPRPEQLQTKQFKFDSVVFRQQAINQIEALCQDGVAIIRKGDKVNVEFSNQQIAKAVLEALHKFNVIANIPMHSPETEPNGPVIAAFSNEEYQAIKPYLIFREVKPPKTISVEDTLVNDQGKLSVITLIETANAAGCNHNALVDPQYGKSGVKWFFDQMENPSINRDIKEADMTHEMRKEIKVKGVTPIHRKLKKHKAAVRKQEPLTENPPLSEYWTKEGRPIAREVNEERGAPKNSIFLKKTSWTILANRQRMFQGFQRLPPFPVCIISDVNKMHTHGERYIWNVDAHSNNKFWVGGNMRSHSSYTGISLPELQSELLKHNAKTDADMINWNEVLLGGTKGAISGLACPGDISSKDEATLSFRLNFIEQAIMIKNVYGVDVPLLINDGKTSAYQYTEEMMASDILKAWEQLKDKTYPFMPTRDIKYEYSVIINFFEMFSDIPFTKDKTNQQDIYDYIASLALTPEIVMKKVQDFKIIGGIQREREYLNNYISTHILDQKEIDKLISRQLSLNHPELIKELLTHVKNNHIPVNLTGALDLIKHKIASTTDVSQNEKYTEIEKFVMEYQSLSMSQSTLPKNKTKEHDVRKPSLLLAPAKEPSILSTKIGIDVNKEIENKENKGNIKTPGKSQPGG